MINQSSLTKKVKKFILEYHMTQTESHILAALSGGADSVCLLCVLKELEQELGITVSALHVHHGIRGVEADRDVAFCKELCAALDVPCQVVYADVPAVAEMQKMSLEEAARVVRYRELETHRQQLLKEMKEQSCGQIPYCDGQISHGYGQESPCGGYDPRVKIAVAHHREDQAETVLWNLFRGSGLKGLGGMEPINGAVIRPLLEISKEEILDYLQQQETGWQQDSTNDSDNYTRNRIRHHILGYAREHINEKSADHICQAARLASQADAYLRSQARRWLETEQNQNDSGRGETKSEDEETRQDQVKYGFVSVSRLTREEEILQSYILREMLGQCHDLTDVTARHVDAIRSLLTEVPGGSAGRSVTLGRGVTAHRSYDRMWIQQVEVRSEVPDESSPTAQETVEVDLQQLLKETKNQTEGNSLSESAYQEIRLGDNTFLLRVFSCEKTQKIPTNQYTKWINYDTLGRTLVFRTRRAGDYILLPGGGRKTVKSYMIDEKIPAEERDRIPVIAQGSHVLWIVGYRLSEGAKIGKDTHLVLEIQMHGG